LSRKIQEKDELQERLEREKQLRKMAEDEMQKYTERFREAQNMVVSTSSEVQKR